MTDKDGRSIGPSNRLNHLVDMTFEIDAICWFVTETRERERLNFMAFSR
jgi:hypothetical protein